MSLKVDLKKLMELSEGAKRLNRTTEQEISGLYSNVNRTVQDTRSRYSESYVQSAANSASSLLNEIKSLAKSISDRISQQEKGLNNAVNVYQAAEEKSKKELAQQGIDGSKGILDLRGNMEKLAIFLYSAVGITLVATDTVIFELRNPKDKKRVVIHTADWVKEKGNNSFLKKLANSIDKQIRKPGSIMKSIKLADQVLGRIGLNFGLNISQAKNFQHWIKNVIAGVTDYTSGIRTSLIPKMIAKRIYPINVLFNVLEEGVTLIDKINKGTITAEDIVVAGTNIAVKGGATYVGAVVGGAIGTLFGPGPGTAIGAFAGGFVGSLVGDVVAPVVEKGVRWVFSLFK